MLWADSFEGIQVDVDRRRPLESFVIAGAIRLP